ncbi:MAG: BatA and WFA domain-containing protein [Candidatus Hydrogenedentes bacterium]|nr:BatA and WFA domain-containing protein [Candidatus Hydrogenedentota bacterium]
MGLLMPILLGGLALAGLPWIIHRIRRPANNPTPFSSLMFLPESVPPVRHKKQIEHPWLMVLRMIILGLLALAFARPYVLSAVVATSNQEAERLHVLLVDTSLSTTGSGQFEKTMAAARARLAELGNEPVGVVTFQERAQVLAPLDAAAGTAAKALDSMTATFGATNYLAGLKAAEQMLLPNDESTVTKGEAEQERIIHLVSDLQRTGLPDELGRESLARGVSLRLVPLSPLSSSNAAVDAVVLEARAPSTLIARVRLRNYGTVRIEGQIEYRLNDAPAASQPITLQAESGVNVSLSAETDLSQPAQVELRLIAADGLVEDNSGYAVYTPDPVRDIGVVIDPAANRAQPIPFLEAALAESQPVPWRWAPVNPAGLAAVTAPVLVVPGWSAPPADAVTQLAAYVEGGGRLLMVPSNQGFPTALTDGLLKPAGVEVAGPRYDSLDPSRYALLSWIDFSDPAFQAFRSSAYSDFSMLRFQNYFPMRVAGESTVRIAARLQGNDEMAPDPAMIAFDRGAGRVVAWAFPLDPDWTNITRTRRFVPLLHETVALLLPPLPPLRSHPASTAVSAPPVLAATGLYLRAPGGTEAQSFDSFPNLDRGFAPGFLRWQLEATGTTALVEAVNIQTAESDLHGMNPDEFLLRLGAAPTSTVAEAPASGPKEPDITRQEFGYPVLILLAIACLLETVVAAWTGRRATVEQRIS